MQKLTGITSIIIIVILIVAAMGIFNLFNKTEDPGPDEQVLMQLKDAGSDLSKPHDIEFFLFFPTKGAADSASNRIKENGFDTAVKAGAETDEWVCYAYKTMIPELRPIQETSLFLNEVADAFGGKYDGWGTEVEY